MEFVDSERHGNSMFDTSFTSDNAIDWYINNSNAKIAVLVQFYALFGLFNLEME